MNSKKLLVIQFRTDVSREHEQSCIQKHMDLSEHEIWYYNVFDDTSTYEELFNIIKDHRLPTVISGSGEYYISRKNDTPEMQERVDAMIKGMCPIIDFLMKENIPTIGLCFGHQLMALCLGADLGFPAEHAETGIFQINLNDKGQAEKIFEGLPTQFNAILGHQDTVLSIPEGAELLASSQRCETQAFKYSDMIYSTQFHPELDYEGLQERLQLYPSYVQERKEGEEDPFDPSKEVHIVTKILDNFLKIAGIKNS